jgi:hypothetical protein
MATAVRGHGEMAAVHAQLAGLGAAPPADLLERTTDTADAPGFARSASILAGIETDLEDSDHAPTRSQSEAVDKAAAEIDVAWRQWSSLRDHDLATFNAARVTRGQKPIAVPAADQLRVTAGPGGEMLP